MNTNSFDLKDIPLKVEAHIRCFRLKLEELIELQPGSIIKSRRAAGDSVDIRVGGQLICQGEIIVIDNRLAVRLSDFEERS
jgi:flagellar motor switch protein FliN